MANSYWSLCVAVLGLFCTANAYLGVANCRRQQSDHALTAIEMVKIGLRMMGRFEATGLGFGKLDSDDVVTLRARYFGEGPDAAFGLRNDSASIAQRLLNNIDEWEIYCIQRDDHTFDPACANSLNGSAVSHERFSVGLCPSFYQQPLEDHIVDHHRHLTVFDASDWVTSATTLTHMLVYSELITIARELGFYVVPDQHMPCNPFDTNTKLCYVHGHGRAQWAARRNPILTSWNAANYALYATALSIGSVVGMPEPINAGTHRDDFPDKASVPDDDKAYFHFINATLMF